MNARHAYGTRTAHIFFIISLTIAHSLIGIPICHFFGDSHASFCFSPMAIDHEYGHTIFEHKEAHYAVHIPYRVHHIAATTMHRIGRDGLKGLDVSTRGVRDGDIVVFMFGEIDARCHIGRQRDQLKRDVDEIINTLVYNYVRTIHTNCALFESITPVIALVVPPSDLEYNPSFPYWGLLSDRAMITKKLNDMLKHFASRYNIPVIDTYAPFALRDGSIIPSLTDGTVHISKRFYHMAWRQFINALQTAYQCGLVTLAQEYGWRVTSC